MTDLTRPIMFRGANLNDAAPGLGPIGLVGRSVDRFDPSAVGVDQYIDKRSQLDGMDFQGIGNLSMAARTLVMTGTVYDTTRPKTWQALAALQTLLDPVQCYRDDQFNQGFLPLSFSVPTGPSGAVGSRYILARPDGLKWTINRDAQGTGAKVAANSDSVPMGIAWTCQWATRDPRVYGDLQTVALTGSASGTLTNGGNYPTLLDIVLVASSTGAGTVRFQLSGAMHGHAWAYDLTITVPAGTAGRTVYYRGRSKFLTVLDSSFSATDEMFRRDLLVFATPNSDVQHPLVMPGANAYTVTATGVSLAAGSQMTAANAYA